MVRKSVCQSIAVERILEMSQRLITITAFYGRHELTSDIIGVGVDAVSLVESIRAGIRIAKLKS